MVQKSPITSDVEQFLKDNHKQHTHKELAQIIGCCIETVRRALVRLDLEVIHGAKYQRRLPPKKWGRPCIICGCKKQRPKMQFKCQACHDRERDQDKHIAHQKSRTITLPQVQLCQNKNVRVMVTKENLLTG